MSLAPISFSIKPTFNKICLLSSYGLICTFTGAEAPLLHGILTLGGTMGRVPSSHEHSRILSGLPSLLLSSSSWRMCSKATFAVCSGSPPSCWTLPSSLGRHSRSSTLAASGIALWGPWHTLQWAGIPASSKEKMFLPFKAKFSKGRDPSGARSYNDIPLPASITSSRAALPPGLGKNKNQERVFGWELPQEKRDTGREKEQTKEGRRERRTQMATS